MSSAQRAGTAAMALIILFSAYILLKPSDSSTPSSTTPPITVATLGTTSTKTTGTTTTVVQAKPKPDPGPLLTAKKITNLKFKEGDTIRFRVLADTDEELHVHGYDISKDLTAGKTRTVSFKATITGIFEIEFENSATKIAKLEVQP